MLKLTCMLIDCSCIVLGTVVLLIIPAIVVVAVVVIVLYVSILIIILKRKRKKKKVMIGLLLIFYLNNISYLFLTTGSYCLKDKYDYFNKIILLFYISCDHQLQLTDVMTTPSDNYTTANVEVIKPMFIITIKLIVLAL